MVISLLIIKTTFSEPTFEKLGLPLLYETRFLVVFKYLQQVISKGLTFEMILKGIFVKYVILDF